MPHREPAHDFEFDCLPQEMRLLRQPYVDATDDGRILRENVDQAFLLEPHQCIADRRRTDAELPRPCGARQGDPGGSCSEMIMSRSRSNTCGAA